MVSKKWRWRAFRSNLTLAKNAKTKIARYFNWHHVFGFWALIPLFLIALTATIFHFSLASTALYAAFGETVLEREQHTELERLTDGDKSHDSLFNIAQHHANDNGANDWYSMWLELGEMEGEVRFFTDRSIGKRPALAYSLVLDNNTGQVINVKKQGDWSQGEQAWNIARFLHTGEPFGFACQNIADLASLAARFLTHTGFILSLRRLVNTIYGPSPIARHYCRLIYEIHCCHIFGFLQGIFPYSPDGISRLVFSSIRRLPVSLWYYLI